VGADEMEGTRDSCVLVGRGVRGMRERTEEPPAPCPVGRKVVQLLSNVNRDGAARESRVKERKEKRARANRANKSIRMTASSAGVYI
jgi:hypothetical protein